MSKTVPFVLPATRTKQAHDWRSVAKNEHFVQFYHTSDFLIECLAGFAADGMWKGERVVVIATPEHRLRLEDRLRIKGVDVASGLVTGQLLSFDARETLDKFMVDGKPDRFAFVKVVGEIVERATQGRRLRAFGEMVALLWQDGNRGGAIELEHLWNELSRKHSFSLYCAYPADCATAGADGISLEHICSSHSCVLTQAG